MTRKTGISKGSKHEDDLLAAYFSQIKRASLLSFEEELALSRRIQSGDEAARKRLIESNLRLVVKIAKEFSNSGIALIDLIQEGNIGLIKAASRYDHTRNVRFCTYAAWWIKQSIRRAISNKGRAIRIPQRKEEKLRRVLDVQASLTQQRAKEPSTREIAEAAGMSEAKVRELMSYRGVVASLDAEVQEDSGSLIDTCEDYTYSPERELIQATVREKTMNFLEELMERERRILMYRFEFLGGKRYTLKSIGVKLGISPETVRQIEIKALRKLAVKAEDLRECLVDA
jgi:RNA polymerase primary sigma factor